MEKTWKGTDWRSLYRVLLRGLGEREDDVRGGRRRIRELVSKWYHEEKMDVVGIADRLRVVTGVEVSARTVQRLVIGQMRRVGVRGKRSGLLDAEIKPKLVESARLELFRKGDYRCEGCGWLSKDEFDFSVLVVCYRVWGGEDKELMLLCVRCFEIKKAEYEKRLNK